MKRTTYKVIPYGKWWEYLLKFKFYMAYRAIFGLKISLPAYSLILDNFGLTVRIPEEEDD